MAEVRILLFALLLTTSLGVGCLGSDEGAGSQDQDRNPGTGGQQTSERVLYLRQDLGLAKAPPEDQDPHQVPVGDFYRTWAAGEEQPTWTGPAASTDLLVTGANLTFYYTSDTAVATTGPQDQGFPEFVVYVGQVTDGREVPMGWASVQGPDVVRQGEIVELQADLSLPAGGLVIPAASQPLVKIAPVQAQQEEGSQMRILVNSTETPSRITLTGPPIELEASTPEPALDEQGLLAGSAYALGQTEGASSRTFEIQVPPDALGLTATLDRLQGAGIADIDLEARGPGGEVAAMSVTPEDDEALALYAPNLGAVGTGTWELRVTNYGNVAVQFHLETSLLQPAQAGP